MAKYDSLRKPDRDKLLLDYEAAHHDMSEEEIGKPFRISKQTVSRILLKNKRRRRK